MFNKTLFANLLMTSSAAFSVSATAQAATDSVSTTTQSSPEDEPIGASEIIVTAQRRPERLQNVPVSVTAVSAETLQTRGINNLAQVSLAAPSLQISGDNSFAVRGVGTVAFSNSIESSVAFAQDEVNLTNPGLVGDFYDIAQVEVLNGPQGLLFGKNASAGLLNVTTTRPQLGKYGANLDLETNYRDKAADNSSGVIARAAVNVPLGQTAAARISGFYNYQDPLVNFVGPVNGRNELGMRRFGVRGKLLWEPTPDLSVYVIGDYGKERGTLGLFNPTYRELAPNSVNAAPLTQVGIVAGPDNIDAAGEAGFYRDLTRKGIQGKVAYTLGNGIEISNIAAFKTFKRDQQLDVDATSQNGASLNTQNTKLDQFSNEFRIALPAENRLSGQAGLYYFNTKLDSAAQVAGNNYFPSFLLPSFPFCVGATAVPGAFPPTCSVRNDFFLGNDRQVEQKSESYAAFGQLTFKVTDKLQLLAGGRVTHDKLSINLTQNNGRYFVPLGIPFTGSESFDNTNFSWKAGGQYNFTRNAMVYGTYARGYKGPGFNDNAVSRTGSLVIRPETNDNIEVGAKTAWLNNKLVFNVSLFRSKFSDYQVQSFDLNTASFIVQNAATLKTKGAEVTLTARPISGLTLNGSATILDSKFGNFPGAQCYPNQGCVTFNARGQRPPLSPKLTTTVQALYEFSTSRNTRPFIEANYYHRSEISYTVAPAPGARFGSADILGASAGIRGDNWRASVFCKNCTDQRVPVSIGIDSGDAFNGNTSYMQTFGLNSFRTIGMMFGFNF